MKRIKMGLLVCMLATLLPALVTSPLAQTAHAAASTCGAWSVVKSPNPGHSINILYGIATISSSNVWAVGTADQSGTTGLYQTLTQHWNGSSWSVVKSPDIGPNSNYLYAVTAISSSNVWAVGYYFPSVSITATLIEHWNGSSWSVVKSPNPSTQGNYLYAVVAVSANNIWAVGNYSNSSGWPQTLIEHWNGSSWSVVKSPDPGGSGNPNVLQSAAIVSSNDIWAIGNYETNGHYQALAEHWNGTNWSAITTPSLGYRVNNVLNGVTAISTGDVWAAGYYQSSSGYKTLIEQWNGTKWSVVKSPNAVSDNYLNALVAISANNIWAVGGSGTVYYPVFTTHTLTEQWNGTSWNIVPSSSPGTDANTLYAAAAVDASHVWAVGTFGSPASTWYSHTLSEFYC